MIIRGTCHAFEAIEVTVGSVLFCAIIVAVAADHAAAVHAAQLVGLAVSVYDALLTYPHYEVANRPRHWAIFVRETLGASPGNRVAEGRGVTAVLTLHALGANAALGVASDVHPEPGSAAGPIPGLAVCVFGAGRSAGEVGKMAYFFRLAIRGGAALLTGAVNAEAIGGTAVTVRRALYATEVRVTSDLTFVVGNGAP